MEQGTLTFKSRALDAGFESHLSHYQCQLSSFMMLALLQELFSMEEKSIVMQIILIFSNQILIGGGLLQTAPSPVEESQISECTFNVQSNVKRME